MKNTKWLSLALVAVFAVACDPYDDTKGGTPNVVGAGAANTIDHIDAVEGTNAGGAWTVAGVTCGGVLDEDDAVVNPGAFDLSYFYVTFDRQIDGALVQTSTTDCTPAGGLTITPAAPAGNSWYTCYSPSSGSPQEGGSIFVYQAAAGGSEGWADFVYLPQATYTITGEVAGQAINVTVTPDAATCAP